MTEPPTVHVVAPTGPFRSRALQALGAAARASESAAQLLASLEGSEEREGGIVVLAPDLPASQGGQLARRLERAEGSWTLLQAEAGNEGELRARPLSLGPAESLEHLLERIRDPDPERPLLELDGLLARLARARHDVNNPLTVAMAEVQLLLMDEVSPEIRESLEIVQGQLRRIQALVARLRALKRPDSGDPEPG